MKASSAPLKNKKSPNLALNGEVLSLIQLNAHCVAAGLFVKEQVKALKKARAGKDAAAEAACVDALVRHPTALFNSAVKINERLKPHRKVSLVECLSLAEAVDFSKPLPEAVPVRPYPKKSGGYRMIHDHGHMHRMAQHAINRVLGEYLKPRPFQFTNKGTQAAIHFARLLIGKGHTYLARLDIKDFYPNFSADALIKGLLLPKDVAEHAVIGRYMKVCLGTDQKTSGSPHGLHSSPYSSLAQTLLPLARQGIPIGSATSSVVSMLAISRLEWSSIQDVQIINFADDFFVLAKTLAKLEEGTVALIEAVANLPDGQFTLQLKEKGHVSSMIGFLGHKFYVKDGTLKVAPSDANLEKMHQELCELELKLQPYFSKPWKKDQAKVLALAATYYAKVQGYKAAFSACTELETRWLVAMFYGLDDALQSLGITAHDAEAAVKPWMTSKINTYAFND